MPESKAAPAVTGLGLVSSLGVGASENWRALSQGRSGVRPIDAYDTGGLPTYIAGRVRDEAFQEGLPHQRVLKMARVALQEALDDAGLDRAAMERLRSRLFMATPHSEVLAHDRVALSVDSDRDPELLWLGAQNAPTAYVLKDEFGIGGAPAIVSTACASSASAIQLAVEALRRGDIDVAVVVAADATAHPEGLLRFSLLSALSTRNDAPEQASRPFSSSRDGFVMGEGAAALIIERAPREGARARARILGCGDATDNFHRTRSHPSGRTVVRCMEAALADAGLTAADVDYVNAHGTSTPENDKMEALGLRLLLGERAGQVPVSSNKSMVGHTLCAAGAVEAAFTILSLEHGFLPPTINHDEADEDLGLDVVPNQGRASEARVALSNSFGFGGQNVSLVIGKAEA